jgi:hypothetical protein
MKNKTGDFLYAPEDYGSVAFYLFLHYAAGTGPANNS